MYRRYTNVSTEGSSPNQIKQIRIRDIIIVILLAGLVVLLLRAMPAFRYQDEQRSVYIRKMVSECNEAIENDVKALSRYNSGDSSQTLARIRSHLSAIQALNNVYMTQSKQFLVPEEQMTALVRMVDNYLYDISKGGQNTSVQQTDLSLAMEQLQAELDKLE